MKSVTPEITEEPVTTCEVKKVLGWLGSQIKLDAACKALNCDQKSAPLDLGSPNSPMIRLPFIAALLALLLPLAGCGERHSWRQKLVLEVETPHGVVSGGSVIQISMHWLSDWERFASANGVDSDVRGEASFVEVAPGRFLFALINSNSYALGLQTYNDGTEPPSKTAARLSGLKETRPPPRKLWPMLVTFIDIADPKTVTRVNPDNLAASFGRGYRLKAVTLEITDEPVTEGDVDKVLGWLNDYYDKLLDGRSFQTIEAENRLANSLGAGNFDTVRN